MTCIPRLEVHPELINGGEVAGASWLADDAHAISPGVRQVEGVGSKAACVRSVGIRRRHGHARNIHPGKVLPHLNPQLRLIPTAVREHGPGGVDHLVDVVNLGPDVAPPVRCFYLLVVIVFAYGRISAIQLVGAATAAEGSEMCALANGARTGRESQIIGRWAVAGRGGLGGLKVDSAQRKPIRVTTAADVALQPQRFAVSADELRGDGGAVLSAVPPQTKRAEVGRLKMLPGTPGVTCFIELMRAAGP